MDTVPVSVTYTKTYKNYAEIYIYIMTPNNHF